MKIAIAVLGVASMVLNVYSADAQNCPTSEICPTVPQGCDRTVSCSDLNSIEFIANETVCVIGSCNISRVDIDRQGVKLCGFPMVEVRPAGLTDAFRVEASGVRIGNFRGPARAGLRST